MRGLALRVITNSLPVLHELSGADQDAVEVVAIGGRSGGCRTRSEVVARRAHRGRPDGDRLLMSVTGIAPDGVMTDADALEAELKRAMLVGATLCATTVGHA